MVQTDANPTLPSAIKKVILSVLFYCAETNYVWISSPSLELETQTPAENEFEEELTT